MTYAEYLDAQIQLTQAWTEHIRWMDHRQTVLDQWVACPGPMPITEHQRFTIHGPHAGDRGIAFSRDELIVTAKAHGKYSEGR